MGVVDRRDNEKQTRKNHTTRHALMTRHILVMPTRLYTYACIGIYTYARTYKHACMRAKASPTEARAHQRRIEKQRKHPAINRYRGRDTDERKVCMLTFDEFVEISFNVRFAGRQSQESFLENSLEMI